MVENMKIYGEKFVLYFESYFYVWFMTNKIKPCDWQLCALTLNKKERKNKNLYHLKIDIKHIYK